MFVIEKSPTAVIAQKLALLCKKARMTGGILIFWVCQSSSFASTKTTQHASSSTGKLAMTHETMKRECLPV